MEKIVKKAYIYNRVSRKKQAVEGKGLQRQEDKAIEFIDNLNKQELPYKYEIVNKIIYDNVSAYSGANTDPNAGLGGFLAAAEDGEVDEGSLFVIETVDRVSRLDPEEAKLLFSQFKKCKIDIAIVKYGVTIEHDKKLDMGVDIFLTAIMHLAHIESEQKSKRIRATFDLKRQLEKEGGVRRTTICPAWLQPTKDKKAFETKGDFFKTIQFIFKRKLEKVGAQRICVELNNKGIPSFTTIEKGGETVPRPWSKGMVEKYLKMRQVTGEFQPKTTSHDASGKREDIPLGDPIEEYYPVIVSKDDFNRAQNSFRKLKAGRVAKNFSNLFAYITKCPTCGGTLTYNKSARAQPKFRCRNHNESNGCSQENINYAPVEEAMVKGLVGLDYSKLQGKSFEALMSEIDTLEFKRSQEQEVLTKLESFLSSTKNLERMSTLNKQVEDKYKVIGEINAKINEKIKLKGNYDLSLLSNIKLVEKEDRERYNLFIRQFVEYIVPDKNSVAVRFKTNKKNINFYYGKDNKFSDDNTKKVKELISGTYKRFHVDMKTDYYIQHSIVLTPPEDTTDLLTFIKYKFDVDRIIAQNPDEYAWLYEHQNEENHMD